MLRAVELAGNQTTIPGQDGIRFGNAGHFHQIFPAQAFSDLSQGRAFGVGEPQTPREVGAEDSILCDQVLALEEQALVHRASDVRH